MSDDEQISVPRDWVPLLEWDKLHYKKQLMFLDSIYRNWGTLFLAGNGTGKTHIGYWALTMLTLGIFPGQNEMRMRPPLKIKILVQDLEHGMNTVAKETLFDPCFLPSGQEIGALVPYSAIKGDKIPPWSKEDKSIKWVNGSVWHFMTSEQERRQHSGTNFDILFSDEEPDEPQYDESVRGLRTAKGGGKVIITMTPPYEEGKGPSWTKFKILDPYEDGRVGNWGVIRAAMHENPAITSDFIAKFSEGKTETQVKVQVYGEYPTFGRLCHPDFEDWLWDPKKKTGHLVPVDWHPPWDDEEGKFEFAMDYHNSKPTAGLWTWTDKEGNVYVYDELRPVDTDGKTISEICDVISALEGDRWFRRKIRRVADPKMKDKSNALIRGFSPWDEFRNCGMYFTEGYNKQPGVGISIMNDFFRGNMKDHPRLFVRESCETLRKQLKNHYWLKDGTPDPKFSDWPICLRYIVQQKARKAKAGMYRKTNKWGITSYDGLPGYGPYGGHYLRVR
jgi:hypothetical protein